MDTAVPLQAAVFGADAYAEAAVALLRQQGARVTLLVPEGQRLPPPVAAALAAEGVTVQPASGGLPARSDLAVISPDHPQAAELGAAWASQPVPLWSELELGYRHALCLSLGIAGTNGKSTTAQMVGHLLRHAHRRVQVAGDPTAPLCRIAPISRELDYVVVEATFGQLAGLDHFRPVVAVLLNLAPAPATACARPAEVAGWYARLFRNQQCFDWAIVQSEALAQLSAAGFELPSKVITFSSANRRADLWWDRGLLLSRLADWAGPLLDLAQCRVRGPHHAENLMAALAVGHVLRVPLEEMVEALRRFEAGPGVGERVAERRGVTFINDSRASNPLALRQALQTEPLVGGSEPNIVLIAGGHDDGFEFHDLGPLLSQRVKRAFLLGAAAPRMRAAWSLFTPCAVVGSLLEAVQSAADVAEGGDVVLFSPACSEGEVLPRAQLRGEAFREAVRALEQRGVGGPALTQQGTRGETQRCAPEAGAPVMLP
jgi:UDP-N-acetylmuramoylalanine--D-glutamate ligase